MGHPLIDEFCRAHDFKPEFLRRCQREFRDIVNPLIDTLEADNARLRADLALAQHASAPRRKAEATPA